MEVVLLLRDQDDFVDWMNALRKAEIGYQLDSVETESDEFRVELTLLDAEDLSKLLMAHGCRLVSAHRVEYEATFEPYVAPQPYQPQVAPWPGTGPGPQLPQWLRDGTGTPSYEIRYIGDPILSPAITTSARNDGLKHPVTPTTTDTVVLGDSSTPWTSGTYFCECPAWIS